MRRITTMLGAVALVLLLAGPAGAITAGPDDFGYTAADDAEASVDYSWVDMTGGSTLTLSDDDQSAAQALGFTFTFYGQEYTEVYVLSNGVVVFDPLLAAEYSPFFGTQCPLPVEDEVDGMVAFYQRDWNPEDGGTVYVDSGGTAPDRWWGVTFDDVPIFRDPGSTEDPDPATVQLILFENGSEAKIQVETAGIDAGADTMFGVEAANGISGLSFPNCMTDGYAYDSQAIVFTPPAGGTPVVPATRVGWDQPGTTVTHGFTVFNLEATDVTFDITVTGNTWTTTPSTASLNVTAGGSSTFDVTVDIDSAAVGGDADEATVTLSPTGGGDDVTTSVLTLVQDAPDTWQLLAYMPVVVDRPAVGADGTDLVMVGGYQYDALAVQYIITPYVQVLHTDTMAWEHSDDTIGGTLTHWPSPALDAAGCAMNGKMYVFGGQTGDTTTPQSDETHIYDIATDTWTTGAAMPEVRMEHTAVCDATNEMIYIVGGWGPFDTEGSAYPQDNFWAYDAATDAWDTGLEQLPGTRVRASAELVDADTILVAGGVFDGGYSKTTHSYSISGDAWTREGDLVFERFYNASGILPPGRMCLSGGTSFADGGTLHEDTYECFSDGYWIPQVAVMPLARTYCKGTTIDDHLVVVGGVETDSLAFPPGTYTATNRVDRYPTASIPDAPPDTATDTVEDTATDPADDTDADMPEDTTVSDTTDDTTPADSSTDVIEDTETDTGDGDGDGDSGCGCSIVY